MNAENVAVNISGILPYPRKFIINNNSQLPPLHDAHNYNLKQSCSSSFSSLYFFNLKIWWLKLRVHP